MKKLIKPIAALAFVFTLSGTAVAQKTAHIAMDSLITIMPETKKAQEIAQTYAKDLEKVLTQMQSELETKYADYQTNAATYSDLVKKTKEDELQALNQRIQDYRGNAQQEYQKKYGELSKPIYEKANKAIKEVAKKNGYKYVLDTSSGVVIYSEPGDDILLLVKKELETMPEAVLPGANSASASGTAAPPKQTPQAPKTQPKGK